MTKRMNHRERMEAMLQHEAVDQIPVPSGAFPVDDQDPLKLAAATIQFQNTYEFDFIKYPFVLFCTAIGVSGMNGKEILKAHVITQAMCVIS
jgi:uroporphyrinogen decarboxylase